MSRLTRFNTIARWWIASRDTLAFLFLTRVFSRQRIRTYNNVINGRGGGEEGARINFARQLARICWLRGSDCFIEFDRGVPGILETSREYRKYYVTELRHYLCNATLRPRWKRASPVDNKSPISTDDRLEVGKYRVTSWNVSAREIHSRWVFLLAVIFVSIDRKWIRQITVGQLESCRSNLAFIVSRNADHEGAITFRFNTCLYIQYCKR